MQNDVFKAQNTKTKTNYTVCLRGVQIHVLRHCHLMLQTKNTGKIQK